MSKQDVSNVAKPPCVLSGVGIELLNCGPTRSTGFSIAAFNKNDEYREDDSRYYYIFVVLRGSVSLSCKLYRNIVLERNHMIFVPKESFFKVVATEDTELLTFAFTTTIIRTDRDVLNYFCSHARKFKYSYHKLRLCDEMQQVTSLIRSQLVSKKIKGPEICDSWNTLFFHTVQTFYDRSKVVAFMRPLFSSSINFKTFIESNYIESAGNVSYLIELSGIPPTRFHSLFFENFGMTAKTWLDTKAKQRIQAMAAMENITVTDMAKVFKVSTQRFCGLCRRLFECTPRELIVREQKEAKAKNKASIPTGI